jgi:hypothetical protein
MPALSIKPDKNQVLTKAFIRMQAYLELTRHELSTIVGPSEATLSRLFANRATLDVHSKEGQLAILLLRLYRSLDALFGGNQKQCQLWLRSDNRYLKGKPIEVIQSIAGLIYTIQYLDAMRGKH